MLINVSHQKYVLIISINRPKVLNALNVDVLKELKQILVKAETDKKSKVIVITGNSDKAFVAGADINEFLALKDEEEGEDYSLLGQSVFSYIERMSKPVICAINGFALGGGLELALSCDIRFASEKAILGLPEIKLGLFPGYGGAQRLPRLVGKGRALHLMFSGDNINAQEAQEIGIIESIFPHESLLDSTCDYATRVAAHPSEALSSLKRAVNKGVEIHLDDALNNDAKSIGKLMVSDAAREKANQFINNSKQR